MDQLGLKGDGTCAATCPKFVEEVVEGYGGCESKIKHFRHYLAHHLHETNTMVVLFSLGNQYHRLSCGLLCQSPLPERRLHEFRHHLPVGFLRKFRRSPALLLSVISSLSAASSFSLFLATTNHPLRCLAHILEVSPEQ